METVPTFSVLTTVSNSATLIVNTILFASFLFKSRSSEYTTMPSTFKLTIVYYLVAIIYCVLVLILYGLYPGNDAYSNSIGSVFARVVTMFGALCWCSTYLLLLHRLSNTFKDSVYEPKRYQIVLHCINMLVLLISTSVYQIASSSRRLSNQLKILPALCVWFVLLSAGYAHLLYSFNRNLLCLVLSQRQSTVKIDMNLNGSAELLNARQKSMLLLVRKHTILGALLVLSALCLVIGNALSTTSDIAMVFSGIVLSYISFNGMSVGIYLGFSFNKKEYHCLCKVCDKQCSTICVRLAERKASKMHANSLGYVLLRDEQTGPTLRA